MPKVSLSNIASQHRIDLFSPANLDPICVSSLHGKEAGATRLLTGSVGRCKGKFGRLRG
jgi:hypothetical protein